MNDMRQFVCWSDSAVMASTPRDAASSQPGHFQAVHHPLRLRRRSLAARGGGQWIEESEIVRVLEGPLRPDGYLLVPIVGGSGTGKSHLVRWARDRTRDHTNWESRYLPKNRTSIRRVIEIVIEGLNSPAADAARDALLSAPAQSESDQELADRLMNELALVVAAEPTTTPTILNPKSAQMADKLRRELPDILHDPVVRRRLTRDGAVVPRLVGLARRGRTDDDGLDDDAIRITDDDLPLQFEEIGEASKGAQRLLTQLGSNPDLTSVAVSIINEALPAAVKRVFVSGHVDLTEIFREIRKELLASDKELVLFIEDLTVLHGVEREFLDAIIEPARSDDGDLCALRVLFAVTEGHFDGLDTVRTRCEDAYWLDAAYSPEGVGRAEAASFLGRYLNACRLDPKQVEDSWTDRRSDAWLPNACDSCDHQVHCHETFGQSEEGYGLYPYNSVSIDRLVTSLSSNRFDPREVVRELVHRFLTVAASELGRGDFPSDVLVAPFNENSDPIDPILQSELKTNRPADFSRAVNSIRYWSQDMTAVEDSILFAFGLDALGPIDVAPVARTRAGGKPRSSKAPESGDASRSGSEDLEIASQLRSPWSSIYDELNSWASNQKELSAGATRRLKTLVHKTILQSLDFSALPVNLGTAFDEQKRFDRDRHLRIAGSVTDQRHSQSTVVIERDADTAAALQGLILLAELPDVDDYSRADVYRRQVARYLDEWIGCATRHLEQVPEAVIHEAITGLLACAIVSGECETLSDPRDYLAALFSGNWSTSGGARSSGWQAVLEAARSTHHRLRPVLEACLGEARGTGDVRAVRADQILTHIEELTKSWRLESTDSATDRFLRSLKPAVQEEWDSMAQLATTSASHVDPGQPWRQQTERVLEVVQTAHRLGRLDDPSAARELTTLAAATDENAHSRVLGAAELVKTNPPFFVRLQVIASDLPDIVKTTGAFVSKAERALSGIATDLAARRTGALGDEALEDVSSAVLAATDRLVEAVEGLQE